jgi:ATP-dependent Clp protease adaptor protein ClpS
MHLTCMLFFTNLRAVMSSYQTLQCMHYNSWNPKEEEESDLLTLTGDEKQLVLHNDDHNTFDWVIRTLMEVCHHAPEQAEQCAFLVHYKGKCIVKHGPEPVIEKMHITVVQRGLTATVQ